MSNLTTLKNSQLTVLISSLGAELQSIKTADGVERLWQGHPDFWTGRAPVLFPIVGAVRDNKYTLADKEYTLMKHGFARKSEFVLEEHTDTSATYLLESSDSTRAVFPFDFELRIVYTLNENALDVKYILDNKSSGPMYFSIGAHEGYSCPGGFENYSVIFDETETLSSRDVDCNTGLLLDSGTPVMNGESTLKMKKEYFAIDALIFLDAKSRGVTLVDDRTGYRIRIDFPGFDTLLMWTKPDSEFLCIEPWCGAPDFASQITDFAHKPRINCVDIGSRFERTHTITFLGK